MPAKFVHLKLHTEFSLTNGLVRIKPLIKQLVDEEFPAVAITDQSNLCALVKVRHRDTFRVQETFE